MIFNPLSKYYSRISAICNKDHEGIVHLNSEKIALDNSHSNCYIYEDGDYEFDKQSTCIGEYEVTKSMVLVGAIPKGIPSEVVKATVSSLYNSDIEILRVTTNKSEIYQSEGIDISKFVNVAIVRVQFALTTYEIYDRNCDYDVCYC